MTLIEFLLTYRYLAVFFGVIVEGPVVMAATGLLVKLGYFDISVAFALLLVGDLVSDVLWYTLGYFRLYGAAGRFGDFIGFRRSIADTIAHLYRKHQTTVIIGSKLSMGFGFNLIVLVTAGILRVPLPRFIVLNAIGGVVWVGVFLSLGYSFGTIYLAIDRGLQTVSLVVAAVFLIAILYGIGRLIRKQFVKRMKSL